MTEYDKGEFWEKSIEVCQLLCKAYEAVLYNIPALSKTLRQQADYWIRF